jgi:hypothetical protein
MTMEYYEQKVVVLRLAAQVLEDAGLVVLFHEVPGLDLTVSNGVLDGIRARVGHSLVSNVVVQVLDASLGRQVSRGAELDTARAARGVGRGCFTGGYGCWDDERRVVVARIPHLGVPVHARSLQKLLLVSEKATHPVPLSITTAGSPPVIF